MQLYKVSDFRGMGTFSLVGSPKDVVFGDRHGELQCDVVAPMLQHTTIQKVSDVHSMCAAAIALRSRLPIAQRLAKRLHDQAVRLIC